MVLVAILKEVFFDGDDGLGHVVEVGGGRGSKGNVVSSHECGRGRGGQNDDEDEKK